MMFLPQMNPLINYRNPKVLTRYAHDFPESKMTADEAFVELMKFIWLCLKHKLDLKRQPDKQSLHFSCVIHAEMEEIDNMWHTFLLFTRDYHQFCNEHLGGHFFHHEPMMQSDGGRVDDKQYEEELTRYLNYIYDQLGEDTLIKWFGCLL